MNYTHIVELSPVDNRRSFYGKAKMMYDDAAAVYVLHSYGTPVCTYSPNNDTFTRLWSGYSATTLRHVNAFRDAFCGGKLSKAAWCALPVGVAVPL